MYYYYRIFSACFRSFVRNFLYLRTIYAQDVVSVLLCTISRQRPTPKITHNVKRQPAKGDIESRCSHHMNILTGLKKRKEREENFTKGKREKK